MMPFFSHFEGSCFWFGRMGERCQKPSGNLSFLHILTIWHPCPSPSLHSPTPKSLFLSGYADLLIVRFPTFSLTPLHPTLSSWQEWIILKWIWSYLNSIPLLPRLFTEFRGHCSLLNLLVWVLRLYSLVPASSTPGTHRGCFSQRWLLSNIFPPLYARHFLIKGRGYFLELGWL